MRWPLRLPRARWLLAGFALALAAGVVKSQHLDDRLLFLIKESNLSQGERDASVWLPGYHAVIQGKRLAGLDHDETSDLTYNPLSGTLYTVTGKKPLLVELSRQGEVLRSIPLIGFSNPEGVAMMEDGSLAITDERRRTLSIVKVDDLTTELNAADAAEYDLGFPNSRNKGFEAIAWDAEQGRLLLGKEREPRALFSWDSDGRDHMFGAMRALPSDGLQMRNVSAMSIDPRTRHTLVLSAQSNLLLELDERGEPISFISLIGGLNGLHQGIPRAEGVAMDETGTIYMVSEPNLFYVFRKDPAVGAPAANAAGTATTDAPASGHAAAVAAAPAG
ncbi:SdiA-regulated domain-containing protein [Pseudomonas mangiferae]|uniref:DNA-binding protein n=1 Tax=Pseudomonas mangiferae TaxID=2593654 RepID=A0A553GTH9_9PSED|nr:SdiA-regulated domain-containing protein [Pseudomonas mangiferae]TRX72804.1 DNA-binding protein [Pseudomonas mangiferae]